MPRRRSSASAKAHALQISRLRRLRKVAGHPSAGAEPATAAVLDAYVADYLPLKRGQVASRIVEIDDRLSELGPLLRAAERSS